MKTRKQEQFIGLDADSVNRTQNGLKEWCTPQILSREPIEAVAAVCSPGGGGKETSPAPCLVFAQS